MNSVIQKSIETWGEQSVCEVMASRFGWKSVSWPPESMIVDEKTYEIEVNGTIVDAYSLNVRSEHILKGRMKNAQTSDANEQVKAIRINPTKIIVNGDTVDTSEFFATVDDFLREANGGTAEQNTSIPHLWEVTDIVLWAPPHIEADLSNSVDSTDPLAPGGTISCLLRGKTKYAFIISDL
jgi:hypothetical protein